MKFVLAAWYMAVTGYKWREGARETEQIIHTG